MADFLKLVLLLQGIVRVGGGRGFVVEHGRKRDRRRLVITAAHCLPVDDDGRLKLPPPHPWSHTEERTYEALLGPLSAEPAVWAECLFVNPIADIAVLGSPDNQVLSEQADAYEHLVASVTPLAIADAPKMGRKRVKLPYGGGSFEVDAPGRGSARLLSLDGEWLKCTVTRRGVGLSVDDQRLVASGMSGSPIISADGEAIGLVSTGGLNPVLRDNLPAWFFPKLDRRGRERSVSP